MGLAGSGGRATGIALIAAVGLGIALRVAPCVRSPSFEYAWDGQYHQRLTQQIVVSGRLAEVDSLSNAPQGRRTATHLPVGLYFAGAWVHRALETLGWRDLRWSLATLQTLAGGLIALPVWLGAVAVFRDRRAAGIAAIVAVFLPAHILRTAGNDLRYDSLGTLLVMTHAALVLATLSESQPRRQWLLSLGAALAFVAAMSVWRVSLLVLLPELAYSALRFLLRGPEAAIRKLWLALALVGTLGLMPISYLSDHRFLSSPIWLGTVGFGLVQMIPGLGRGRWAFRFAALAVVGTVALGWGRLQAATDYAALAGTLNTKLGWTRGHDPDAALMLTVLELQGMSVSRLLTSWQVFSLLGLAFAVSPLLFWWLGGRPSLGQVLRMDAAPATLAFVAGTFVVFTLLFQRSCVLLAPVLAVVIGGLLARAWPATAVKGSQGRPRPKNRSGRSKLGAGHLGFAVLVIVVVGAMASGVVTAATSVLRLAPNQRTAIEFLRTHAPADAIVMCDWDAGYEIQSRAARATVVDGLLESADNRRRIIELYAALMDSTSASLETLCRRYHASWLLLPPSSAIYAMAAVTGDPLADILARHEGVPRGPLTNHLIVHLIENDPGYPRLRRALEAGSYTVFEVMGESRATR